MTPFLLRPRVLRPGDLIGIAAPASPVNETLLAKGEEAIAGLGFRTRRTSHLLARGRYTAGSAGERAQDLSGLLADPEVRAVIFARGGYGAPHLLALLDPELLRKDPKPLLGGSDLTALLLWALKAGVACAHGPMAAREFQESRVDLAEVAHHLTRAEPFGRLDAPAARTLHPGRARGVLTGGCLSLVVASLATPWEIDTEGALLFLEDVDTKPFQIDRMLTQLRLAGKLAGVRGIAFGEMKGCVQHPDQGYTLDEVLAELTQGLGVPVVSGLPCGHTSGVNRLLPFGVAATLDAASDRVELVLEESLCVL